MKPRVFVGSSTEGLSTASAVQANLEAFAEVTVWSQDVFRPGEHTLESLLRQVDHSDFAVLVFSADDIVDLRESTQVTVRDNVVFELGLCMGRLGSKRSFIVLPRVRNFRIPSDLSGINTATFDVSRSDKDLFAALGPACAKIRAALSTPNDNPLEPELRLPVLLRKNLLTPNMLEMLNHIERCEQCSQQELKMKFKVRDSELHYRMQYLRLLSLIEVRTDEDDLEIFSPHRDYVAAREAVSFGRPPSYSSELPRLQGKKTRS